jgi:two-component system sensor histidine kinase HydH
MCGGPVISPGYEMDGSSGMVAGFNWNLPLGGAGGLVNALPANDAGKDPPPAAASEKQLLLSRLLERLAHEIRNPLSSLDIHLQLLEEDLGQWPPQIKNQAAARLEIIRGELRRLESTVDQFMRLAGPSELNLAPTDLAKIVRHVCDLLQPEAATRHIDLTAQISPEVPTLRADGGQLIQALLNLVINALQAIEKEGRVAIAARREGDWCLIEVRDSGPGVPPDRLTTIFEPYFTTKPQGKGIGLWIAQQIVTAHRGAIHAANAPAGGALLAIRLPLAPEAPPT